MLMTSDNSSINTRGEENESDGREGGGGDYRAGRTGGVRRGRKHEDEGKMFLLSLTLL
jgi:hypothetical protein